MKILHIMLACFYIDNYSYQENLLPKYHKMQGNDVHIVASLFTFDKDGMGVWLDKPVKYVNEYGIPVSRLGFAKNRAAKRLRRYVGLKEELDTYAPDVIFIHGLQFFDVDIVAAYVKKHPGISVYVDNHADFSNSAKGWVSKHIQHEILWRRCAHVIEPYTRKFYGVLPARVDFLINEYKLPPKKVDLLVMGADDELVTAAENPSVKKKIRDQYGVGQDDFLIMYGGKTDLFKKQVFLLMDAVNRINNPHLKLIVFGSVIPELKGEILERVSDRVRYIDWILASESYKFFAAADLACFPGRHSVFWEQTVAQGVPLLVKKWDGTTHVDCGGNAKFLTEDSADEIKKAILEIMEPDCYQEMRSAAAKARESFLYSNIAKRSIT